MIVEFQLSDIAAQDKGLMSCCIREQVRRHYMDSDYSVNIQVDQMNRIAHITLYGSRRKKLSRSVLIKQRFQKLFGVQL